MAVSFDNLVGGHLYAVKAKDGAREGWVLGQFIALQEEQTIWDIVGDLGSRASGGGAAARSYANESTTTFAKFRVVDSRGDAKINRGDVIRVRRPRHVLLTIGPA